MKKVNDANNQVLNLGSLHEEMKQEQAINQRKKWPMILLILGILFIGLGIGYPKIEQILNLEKNKSKNTRENLNNQNEKLTCTTSMSDKTIGISTKVSNTYTFKKDLLQELKVVTIYTVMEDHYDAGVSNLSLYNDKYLELEATIATIEGIKLSHNLEDNTLVSTTVFELDQVDVTKIPQNNFITLTNTKEQTKREIKEIEGKAGHICK